MWGTAQGAARALMPLVPRPLLKRLLSQHEAQAQEHVQPLPPLHPALPYQRGARGAAAQRMAHGARCSAAAAACPTLMQASAVPHLCLSLRQEG